MRCNSQVIISSDSSVILNPLQLSDQGCYTCNVKVDKLVKRRTIDIKVVTDPSKLRISFQKGCVVVNIMVTFICDDCKENTQTLALFIRLMHLYLLRKKMVC